MAAKVLTTNQLTSDAAVDAAVATLPPLPDNVLLIVRNLQAQITALSARVTALGG
jgi:hypothetical protein